MIDTNSNSEYLPVTAIYDIRVRARNNYGVPRVTGTKVKGLVYCRLPGGGHRITRSNNMPQHPLEMGILGPVLSGTSEVHVTHIIHII